MEHFREDRAFRLVYYSASFSSLILLNTADRTRTVVGFLLVSALKLPMYLPSLCVRDPHDHESALAADANALSAWRLAGEPHKLFVLEAGETVGWVMAGEMIAWEDGKVAEYVTVENLLGELPEDALIVDATST